MSNTVLRRAGQLFRRRRFSAVIRLLEQQIFRFRESPEFYTLLGKACLYSGDYGGAGSYLKRAEQLHDNDVSILLSLAAVALKRSDTEEALDYWLKVIDLDPGSRIARRGLDLLRRVGGGSLSLADVQAPGRFDRLLPRIPPRPLRAILPAAVLLAAAALAAVYLLRPDLPAVSKPIRTDIPDLSLVEPQPALTDDASFLSGNQTGFTYLMRDDEIRSSFDLAKRHLAEYRDNLALREINRILLSNANAGVKERARALAAFVREPDFTTVRDSFPYLEVAREPRLYQGAFVVWRGKVANLSVGTDRIAFDLLVGYESEKELLGIVPVSLGFSVQLENGAALEVLGRVGLDAGRIVLEGISVHRLRGI